MMFQDVPRYSYGFPGFSYDFPLIFLWFSSDFPMFFQEPAGRSRTSKGCGHRGGQGFGTSAMTPAAPNGTAGTASARFFVAYKILPSG
jgi:hypothetical protein